MKIDDRTMELIAVGASITANCQPCLEYHMAKARKFGAEDEELAAAIAVARAVRKGAAGKMDEFAESRGAVSTKSGCGEGQNCGCGC